jgi:DNA mismatch repair protein MutL
LGFRGEALPSIASVSRLRLETCAPEENSGTVVEINGGKIFTVEEAGLPAGTSISVRDLFFNIPARKKFLKAESTELSHIASLVTHYALAHPDKHFELHSATNAMLVAPPVAGYSERVYQVFGKEVLDQLIPVAALQPLERIGLPQPPPWRRKEREKEDREAQGGRGAGAPTRDKPETGKTAEESGEEAPGFGELRVHGFVSKPEIQKLNRNSIYVFVNGRLIRDRLIQHAITEAYRNILPPTVYPVVLLFLDLPSGEVDVNVHPSKTEVRFRQQSVMHDFVRESIRAALMKARPVPQFAVEIRAHPSASPSLSAGSQIAGGTPGTGVPDAAPWRSLYASAPQPFSLQAPLTPSITERFQFGEGISVEGNAALSLVRAPEPVPGAVAFGSGINDGCAPPIPDEAEALGDLAPVLASLKPLGQIRDSFILAVNPEGLWIVDQHVAHERVLFEKILKQRAAQKVERQRLLLPLVIELTPAQQAVFSEISDELANNGFEVEPFGARSVAVKIAPAGIEAPAVEHMLHELLDQFSREEQALNLEKIRARIAASIACHAAIKVNMPLEQNKMEWLLTELAKTDCPMSCPHGRPIVLRYSLKDIQKAFKRI